MYGVDTSIEGTKDILMNRLPLPEEPDPEYPPGPGVPPQVQDWTLDYYKSMYRTEEGLLYTPSVNIHKCMQEAALNFKVKGRGQKTYRDMVRSALVIDPDFIIHEVQTVEPDRRYVRIKAARIVRTRAKLPAGWKLNFRINVLEDQLPFQALNDILLYAGRAIGIHDFRPGFGRFIVTKFAKVTEPDD